MKKTRTYISLFSGAGGLDIGLERAGFRAISLNEIEPVFCETLRTNQTYRHSDGLNYFDSAEIINADIRDLSAADLTANNEGKIDLVVGGPPCQAFSSSGKQLSVLDPRGELVTQFYRMVDEIKPKMLLFENVRGIVTARDAKGDPGGVIKDLLGNFKNIGYSCRAVLLNAADYGGYQRRVRCFILGTRNGTAPVFPEPTHAKKPSLFHLPWKTLEEFLSQYCDSIDCNYTFPTESLGEQLKGLPNGSGLKSKGKAEKTRPGGHWGYRQGTFIADLTLPARTVTGSSSQDWIRWEGLLRRLTFSEITALQGFPNDWHVLGTKAQRYKQVGNAVPSLFGEIIGMTINEFLNNYPCTPAEHIELSSEFKGYIDYTKKDHARNKEYRSRHKHFAATTG
ncbi:MAG: DNA cytosine methyltransferase [Thermodesulfobacteriota bacterium]|nr:DNA cytosine methyltransferase [Thermodesulfobacteriota bacterium]